MRGTGGLARGQEVRAGGPAWEVLVVGSEGGGVLEGGARLGKAWVVCPMWKVV